MICATIIVISYSLHCLVRQGCIVCVCVSVHVFISPAVVAGSVNTLSVSLGVKPSNSRVEQQRVTPDSSQVWLSRAPVRLQVKRGEPFIIQAVTEQMHF